MTPRTHQKGFAPLSPLETDFLLSGGPERFAATRYRSYNGTDQCGVYESVASLGATLTGSQWMVGCWARLPGNVGRVWALAQGSDAKNSFHLKMDTATNRLVLLVYSDTPSIVGTLNHTGIAPCNDAVTWRFLVAFQDGNTIGLWIDDSKRTATHTPPNVAASQRLGIACIPYDTPSAFAEIDCAQLWAMNRVLSNDAVGALYAVGGPHDLRKATGAYKPDPATYVFDDWQGDGVDQADGGLNRGIYGGVTAYQNTTDLDIVVGGP